MESSRNHAVNVDLVELMKVYGRLTLLGYHVLRNMTMTLICDDDDDDDDDCDDRSND